MPLKIYHFHRATGVLLFASEAQADPLAPDRHLIPAHATPLAPPEAGTGEAAVFNVTAEAWALVPDLRGRAYYDTASGEKIVIQEIGQEPAPGWTEVAPSGPGEVWVDGRWELPLATLAARKQGEIDAAYSGAMAALLAGYPEAEVATFSKQEGEARAYLANPAAVTPYLDAAATARGDDKATLAGKIIAKAEALAGAVGAVTGKRQGRRDAIEGALALEDRALLMAITW